MLAQAVLARVLRQTYTDEAAVSLSSSVLGAVEPVALSSRAARTRRQPQRGAEAQLVPGCQSMKPRSFPRQEGSLLDGELQSCREGATALESGSAMRGILT